MKILNEELVNGVMEAYQSKVKSIVEDSLGKGPWNERELDWLVNRLSTFTKNVESLIDSLAEYQEELDKEETSDECTEEDTGKTEDQTD